MKSASPAVPRSKGSKVSVKQEQQAREDKKAKDKLYNRAHHHHKIAPAGIKQAMAAAKTNDPELYKQMWDELAEFNPKTGDWNDLQMQIEKKRKASQGTSIDTSLPFKVWPALLVHPPKIEFAM